MHLHTRFSDGAGSPQELLQACAAAGLRRIAVTDHCEFGHPRDISARWSEYVNTLQNLRQTAADQGITLLIGIETGMGADGLPKAPQHILQAADVVIASVHKVNLPPGEDLADMRAETYWDRYREQIMLAAQSPIVDVIGHIEGYLVADWKNLGGSTFADRRRIEKELAVQHFPLSWYADLAVTAAANQVAVELHGLSESPRAEVVRVLKNGGVRFSIGSDAHALEHVAHTDYARRLVHDLELQIDDFAPCLGLK